LPSLAAVADRRHGTDDRERVQPVTETENVPLTAARGRVLAAESSRRSICRRSTIRPSMAMRSGTAISMPRPKPGSRSADG